MFEGNARKPSAFCPKGECGGGRFPGCSGPGGMRMDIYSVPGFVGDDHRITSEIDGVKAVVDIYSSTSAIAGWSLVAVLRNLVSPDCVFKSV